jgi:hypothetical protein
MAEARKRLSRRNGLRAVLRYGQIFEAVGVKGVPELIPGVGRGEFGQQARPGCVR